MDGFMEAMLKRRSVYGLNDRLPIPEPQLEMLLANIIKNAPTAFNMQSTRMVLLQGARHRQLWNELVWQELEKNAPPENLGRTRKKLEGFAAAYGTILFLDDEPVTNDYIQRYPLYEHLFPDWALQQNGMLQFAVWTALAEQGIGASLQHYNPVVDKSVKETYGLPQAWRLLAQMPFGGITEAPDEKDFDPISTRFLVL